MSSEFDPRSFCHGISISMFAMETAYISEPLRYASLEAFRTWENIFSDKLIESGIKVSEAEDLGMTIHFLIEGALTLATVRQDNKPFLVISKQITRLLREST